MADIQRNPDEARDELRRVGQEITEHFHKVSRFGEPDLADAEWDNWCEELDKLVCKLVGIILATSTFIEEVKHEHRTALVLGYYNGRSRYNPKLWIGG